MTKRIVVCLLVSAGASLWAGPCTTTTLSVYLGSSCTSSGVLFDLWSYDPGFTGVPSTSVLVIPSVAGPVFEFLELGPGWTQPAGFSTSGSIGFRGTEVPALILG